MSDNINQFMDDIKSSEQNNGRIRNIDINDCHNISNLYSEVCDNLNDYKNESIRHNLEKNQVNQYFFSKQNIKYIQDHIRYDVYKKTKQKINQQSNRELVIIMKSMYLQYSTNNDNNLKNEIDYLNSIVIDYSVPKIITNMTQYIGYTKDLNKMYTPIDKPVSDNIIGLKSLKLNNPF